MIKPTRCILRSHPSSGPAIITAEPLESSAIFMGRTGVQLRVSLPLSKDKLLDIYSIGMSHSEAQQLADNINFLLG